MHDIPKFDFHMHTKYLGCANGTMEVPAILAECARIGDTVIGITDHLNTLDKLPLHLPIRRDLLDLEPAVDVYFGVELNFTGCDQGFAYDADVKEELGFQFAIGGIHTTYVESYDIGKIVDIQHRHHLAVCADPLVDVLVHPYWFGQGEFRSKGWPWFDSMKAVPASYARGLGQAAKETGTAVEINACANLTNPEYGERYVEEYVEYLAEVASEGAMFSMGSDAHDIGRLRDVRSVWDVAARIGLGPDRIWRPKGTPFRKAVR